MVINHLLPGMILQVGPTGDCTCLLDLFHDIYLHYVYIVVLLNAYLPICLVELHSKTRQVYSIYKYTIR